MALELEVRFNNKTKWRFHPKFLPQISSLDLVVKLDLDDIDISALQKSELVAGIELREFKEIFININSISDKTILIHTAKSLTIEMATVSVEAAKIGWSSLGDIINPSIIIITDENYY